MRYVVFKVNSIGSSLEGGYQIDSLERVGVFEIAWQPNEDDVIDALVEHGYLDQMDSVY